MTVAVIALVVGAVAFLTAVGAVVAVLVSGGAFGSPDLTGTAPQVLDGLPYSGQMLANEVKRVIEDDGGSVADLTCPLTAHVDASATTVCIGTVDDWREHISVDFQDREGHFVLTEQPD